MKAKKNIALVAHDNRKKDLIEWVEWNPENLGRDTLLTWPGAAAPRGARSRRAGRL